MSAVPDNQGLITPSSQLLGQLLLERGLLSEDQLETALAQQQRTGAQLGETLVELGFVPAGLIGQALATQHGGLLKTEYGFATGFGAGSPSAPAADPPTLPAPAAHALRLAHDASAPSAPAERTETSPALRAAPLDATAPPEEPTQSEEPDLEQTVEAPEEPVLEQTAEEPDELRMRVEELDARLEAAAGRAAELERERDALAKDKEKLASSLDERTRRCDELEAELAETREAAAEPHLEPSVERHLAFVGSCAGYSLVEVDGPPPAADTIVELPEGSGVSGRHRVLRVGAANVPGVDAPCVYLLPLD